MRLGLSSCVAHTSAAFWQPLAVQGRVCSGHNEGRSYAARHLCRLPAGKLGRPTWQPDQAQIGRLKTHQPGAGHHTIWRWSSTNERTANSSYLHAGWRDVGVLHFVDRHTQAARKCVH